MKKNLLILSVFLVMLCSCSKPAKIDMTSEQSSIESFEKVTKKMTPEEKAEFEKAIEYIVLDGIDIDSTATWLNPASAKLKMNDRLNGKTAKEIIAEGERLRLRTEEIEREEQRKKLLEEQERHLKEQEQIASEIIELEEKLRVALKNRELLKFFEVERSRFYFDDSGFGLDPIIELTVENRLNEAVSRAYFHGVLSSRSRAVPWVSEDFNHSILGGLEPRERVTWKLHPSTYGVWGKVPKDRSDMVLTVEVVRLDGPGGETLFGDDDSEYVQERLEGLYSSLDSDTTFFSSSSLLAPEDVDVQVVNEFLYLQGTITNRSGKPVRSGFVLIDWQNEERKTIFTDELPLNEGKTLLPGASCDFQFKTKNDLTIEHFDIYLRD